MMKLSKQIYVIDIAKNWKGIYSPFGHKIAFIYDEYWENIRKGNYHLVKEAIVNYLAESKILVEEGFEETWLCERFKEPKVELNSMYLITTIKCNFACKYCVIIKNIDKTCVYEQHMKPHIGSIAVDFFERHLRHTRPKNARVTFYGGEPMLNKDVMLHCIPKIRTISYPNQENPVEIVMITNGYLYDPQIVELFKENDVGVCVSIDGKKQHHDVARLTKKGSGTFDRVVENYKKYKAAGISMGISCALGTHNAFDLPEICEFFANELEPRAVEFQIPYQVSKEGNEMFVKTSQITENLMEAYKILHSYGIVEGLACRRMNDFNSGSFHYKDCGATGNQLVVAPDGAIGPCHSLVGTRVYYLGNVADPRCDPCELDNFKEWAKRFPLNMPICRCCPFISLCGGGCTYNSYISSGSIWEKDPQVCPYMEGMVKWILREMWKRSGMAAEYGISSET